jgi:hypothetical protein
MEIHGKWTKDDEGYMEFDDPQAQRYYEVITDQYYHVYNGLLEENDEFLAGQISASRGYKMVTDYKTIDEKEEFATSYETPTYFMDLWYESDPVTGKRNYNKGFLRINRKN